MLVIQIDRISLNDEQVNKIRADVIAYFTTTMDDKWSQQHGDGYKLACLLMQYNSVHCIWRVR